MVPQVASSRSVLLYSIVGLRFVLRITCIFFKLIHQPTNALNKIQFMTSIRTTCFGTGLPSSGSLSDQRNTIPTRQSRYAPPDMTHFSLRTLRLDEICADHKAPDRCLCVCFIQNIYSYQHLPGTAVTFLIISQHYNCMLINFVYFRILMF